jgi:hypothetical protein
MHVSFWTNYCECSQSFVLFYHDKSTVVINVLGKMPKMVEIYIVPTSLFVALALLLGMSWRGLVASEGYGVL